MLAYLASPYSHPDPELRERRYLRARDAQVAIARKGAPVVSPIALWHPAALAHDLPTDATFWRTQNRALQAACDVTYVLTIDGWRESLGVQDEIASALSLGHIVHFVGLDGRIAGVSANYVAPSGGQLIRALSGAIVGVAPPQPPTPSKSAPKHDAGKARWGSLSWCSITAPSQLPTSPESASDASAERREVSVKFSPKHDADKARWDLLPWRSITDVVDVLTHGANKYSDDGWRSVANGRHRYFAALMRHLIAWFCDEKRDQESNLPHIAHVICNAIILSELDRDE